MSTAETSFFSRSSADRRFDHLRNKFTDLTINFDNGQSKTVAHRVILAEASPFLENLLTLSGESIFGAVYFFPMPTLPNATFPTRHL